jgi:hypothetical protein
MRKGFIKRLYNSGFSKKEMIDQLKKRYKYLKSKNYFDQPSNQMKYIAFHLKKLGAKV